MANEVAVIFSDLTGFRAAWKDVNKLPQHKRFLKVTVLHQQDPPPIPPNKISSSGHEVVYLYGAIDGLLLGQKDYTPDDHREFAFSPPGDQEFNIPVDAKVRELKATGAQAKFYTYPFNAPDSDAKHAQAAQIDVLTLPLVS